MPKETDTRCSSDEQMRARLESILESANEAMIAKDLDGVITDWNPAAETIFGYPASEIIGRNIRQLVPPDRFDEAAAILAKVRSGERVYHFGTVRRRRDGRLIDVSVCVDPIRTSSGAIIGASEIARDITEEKKKELSLTRLARLYSALSQVNQAVAFSATREELFRRVCHALVQSGGLRAAWVDWEKDSPDRLRTLACEGETEAMAQTIVDGLGSEGPGEFAYRTGQTYVCDEVAREPGAGREQLCALGIRSFAAFPMRGSTSVQGAMVVCAGEARFFGEKEVTLLTEATRNVSLALANFAEREERQRAQRAAEDERRFSATMIESMPGILYFYDEDLRFLRWNQNFEKLSGYSREEIARMTPLDFISDEEKPQIAERIKEVFETGESSIDANFVAKDGTITPFHFTGRHVEYNGRCCLVGLGVEISARKRAEERQRESEGRYRSLFECAPDGILIADADARYVDANSSVCAMLGYTRDELIGMYGREIVAAAEVANIAPAMADIHRKGDYHREWLFRRKDGSTFPADVIATVMPDGNILAMVRDVSQRKRVEDELRWKTAFLEAQVDSALDGILVVNRAGHRILQNQRVSELWKIPPEIASADTSGEQLRFVAGRTKKPEEFIRKVSELNSNPDAVCRDEVELVDDTILDRYSAPVRDAAGTYYGRIWCFRDVTMERRRETELAKALALEKELAEKARAGERAKGEFLAVMSHEVRTPLNGILGFSEILAQTPDLPPEARETAQTIVASGEALLHILDDVLDLSSLESAAPPITYANFSPAEVLENTRLMLASLAKEKKLALQLSVAPDAPPVVAGDAARTRQILLNLTGNALKFTEQGSVTLGFRRGDEPGFMEFFVADTGPGIPSDQIAKIFRPFTQADSSHTRRHGGVGLGLAISQRLAELMKGRLTVTSAPGAGAEFRLSLPLEEVAAAAPAKETDPSFTLNAKFAGRHPLRLLVVEDDKINLRLVTTLFRRLGYDPVPATNGREAVDIYSREPVDCIFMDLQMPEMNGIEATRRIRHAEQQTGSGRSAFIVALTANVVTSDRQKCFEAGMNAYLNKPVNLAAIARVLMEASES